MGYGWGPFSAPAHGAASGRCGACGAIFRVAAPSDTTGSGFAGPWRRRGGLRGRFGRAGRLLVAEGAVSGAGYRRWRWPTCTAPTGRARGRRALSIVASTRCCGPAATPTTRCSSCGAPGTGCGGPDIPASRCRGDLSVNYMTLSREITELRRRR